MSAAVADDLEERSDVVVEAVDGLVLEGIGEVSVFRVYSR